MVDFGLFDFGEFGVLLKSDGEMINSLLETRVKSVCFSNIIVRSNESKLWLAMHKYHNLRHGLDMHPNFQHLINSQRWWFSLFQQLLQFNLKIIRNMLKHIITLQLFHLHRFYLIVYYALYLVNEVLVIVVGVVLPNWLVIL